MSKFEVESVKVLEKAQEELADTTRTLNAAFTSFYKAVDSANVVTRSAKSLKKFNVPDTAVDKVKRVESGYENVGKGLAGFLQGLNGIIQVSRDTIFKGTDIYADYSVLSGQYRKGIVKVADDIRPIFEELKRSWGEKKGIDALPASVYSNIRLTGEEDEAGSAPGYSLTGEGMGLSGGLGAGFGTEFGAGQGQGGMGGDGGPTGIEAQRLRNQEFLVEQQTFNVERLAMTKNQAEQDTALEKQSWNDKLAIAGSSAGAMANLMQNLYVATGSKHRALFEAMKAFSIAETIIETYKSAQLSYAAFAGIPVVGPALGIAAAAAAMAAGMARVKAIKNARPGGATGTVSAGGRANPSFKGGSFNAYPVPQRNEEEPKQTQQITLNIYNPLSEQNWAEIAENNIIPALNDASDRNINLVVKTIAA